MLSYKFVKIAVFLALIGATVSRPQAPGINNAIDQNAASSGADKSSDETTQPHRRELPNSIPPPPAEHSGANPGPSSQPQRRGATSTDPSDQGSGGSIPHPHRREIHNFNSIPGGDNSVDGPVVNPNQPHRRDAPATTTPGSDKSGDGSSSQPHRRDAPATTTPGSDKSGDGSSSQPHRR